jgi:divalent metal cation (Fe/Co/Zn/Cd) transporter
MIDNRLRAGHLRTAVGLELFTVAFVIFEALAALWIGLTTASASLEAFGLDSLIELASGLILLWRLVSEQRSAGQERIELVEHKAARFVGLSLLALAVYIVAQSLYSLVTSAKPEPSIWGIALALTSLVAMIALAKLKLQIAESIRSRALRADGFEAIACAYLSSTLLLGLAANYLFGWWWADPLAALAMVYFIVREAREALSGEHDEE